MSRWNWPTSMWVGLCQYEGMFNRSKTHEVDPNILFCSEHGKKINQKQLLGVLCKCGAYYATKIGVGEYCELCGRTLPPPSYRWYSSYPSC